MCMKVLPMCNRKFGHRMLTHQGPSSHELTCISCIYLYRHASIAQFDVPSALEHVSGVPWRFFAASRHDVMPFNCARPEISRLGRCQPSPPPSATLSRLGRCRWIHQFEKRRIRMREKRRSRAEGIGVRYGQAWKMKDVVKACHYCSFLQLLPSLDKLKEGIRIELSEPYKTAVRQQLFNSLLA